MGYYTRYEFVSAEGGDEDSIKSQIAMTSGYNDPFDDSIKWYDHEADIAQVSKDFPDILIRVDGEGEESGDIWRLAAKNGCVDKVQAELTFRGFNV